jgi:hypothetical protein
MNGSRKHYSELKNTTLIENEDFKLLFMGDLSKEACIVCSCGAKVHLPKVRHNFTMSNYYKHLKSTSCKMMKKKKLINCINNDQSNIDDDHDSSDDETSERTDSPQRKRLRR